MTQRGVCAVVLALMLIGACSDADPSKLPRNNQISGWTREGPPVIVDTEAELYNMIDGGGPKYIERGWVSSEYDTFHSDDLTVQVAVHDMGTASNAEGIFNYDLPMSRSPLNDEGTAVLDHSSSTAYGAKAWVHHYYIQVSIDSRSDAAADIIAKFVSAIMARC